jgi:hypothetical protein
VLLLLQECFDAFKTGPSTVQAGEAFDYKVAVRFFFKPAGPVTVNDTLPAGIQSTSAPATWKANYANGSTLVNQREAHVLLTLLGFAGACQNCPQTCNQQSHMILCLLLLGAIVLLTCCACCPCSCCCCCRLFATCRVLHKWQRIFLQPGGRLGQGRHCRGHHASGCNCRGFRKRGQQGSCDRRQPYKEP